MCCFSKTIHFQYVCGKSQETFDTCNDCNRQLRWREVRDIRAAQHDIILIHPKKVRTVCYAAAAGVESSTQYIFLFNFLLYQSLETIP